MMDEGLAGQAMGQQPQAPQRAQGMGGPPPQGGAMQSPQGGDEEIISQIVQLLLDGVDPQELLENGVPQELLEQAMQIALEKSGGAPQGASQAPQGPATDAGLAATAY
jgi:hypothetical protein